MIVPARGGEADHRRHGAGKRADRGGPPGALLHRRVEEQIADQREQRRSAPESRLHAEPEFRRNPAIESAMPNSSARPAISRPDGKRTIRGAAHLAIGLALVPLIERGRAGGDQAGAEDGVQQQQRSTGIRTSAAAGRPKK